MEQAIIENGVVTNIIVLAADVEGPALDGATLVDARDANIGDTWDGVQFIKPPPAPPEPAPVPQTVSRQQIMAAMMLAGLITEPEWLACYQDGTPPALVQAAIDTLPDASSKLVAKVKWVEFSEARRDDSLIALLQVQAALTNEQLDDLFKTASSL